MEALLRFRGVFRPVFLIFDKTDGVMNAEKYLQILTHNAITSGKQLTGNNLIFQHDNDPKHFLHISINHCMFLTWWFAQLFDGSRGRPTVVAWGGSYHHKIISCNNNVVY